MKPSSVIRIAGGIAALSLSFFARNAQALVVAPHGDWVAPQGSPMPRQPPPHWTQVQVVNPQIAAWRNWLQAQRPVQIARLRQYANGGIFPENRVRPGRLNVFIDGNGRLCAFANLLALSGHRALVDQTSQSNNFIRFADVQGGALTAWTLSSGLTREEIIRVQEPYEYIPQGVPQNVQWQAEQAERARLQVHFTQLINDLEANGDQSIEIELSRLGANMQLAPHDLSQDYPAHPAINPVMQPFNPVVYPVVYPVQAQPVQVIYPVQVVQPVVVYAPPQYPQPVVVYAPPQYPQPVYQQPYQQPYQQYQRPVRVNPNWQNPVVYQPPQLQQVVVMQVQDQQPRQQVVVQPQQVQIQMQVSVTGNGLPMGT